MSRYRPELTGPADAYYDEQQADLYTNNTRINKVQVDLTERALEIMNLEAPAFLLEVGAGSGISTVHANSQGFMTIAVDISMDMLKLNESDNLVLYDVGDGLNFQPGQFDGCFSISCLQWLCYSNRTDEYPFCRLRAFFVSLYCCLKSGAPAVFQFYPENEAQIKLIMDAATAAGFAGELLVDFPHSAAAKKYFLVLRCGITGVKSEHHAPARRRVTSTKMVKHGREWILSKKYQQAMRGDDIRPMSRRSGHKRANWKLK